jgi:hypothetical protein
VILFSVEAAEEHRLIPAALALSSKKSLSKAAKELENHVFYYLGGFPGYLPFSIPSFLND